ncbi:hypothetical protein TIFTF001_027116 [Ficus carica]|uniref:Uncharacterized protein n=1 Tax=Ficus carica TaxID=3494 RepID=A0AA88IZT1_FICCA|nr:hypothetical protein TIFTF001_027116 [Ficus carica]
MASSLKAFFLQIRTFMRKLCAKFGVVETVEQTESLAALHQINRECTNVTVGFCLAFVIEIAVLSAQINSELPTVFHLVSISLSLALASFFVCKFPGSRFPLTAQVLERVGMLFAVTRIVTAVTIPFLFWLKETTWVIYLIFLVLVFLCSYYFSDETQGLEDSYVLYSFSFWLRS